MTAFYEFGGVEFKPRYAELQPMLTTGESHTAQRHIPYSNYDVLDLGGVSPSRYGPIEVRIDPSDLATLQSYLQTIKPLFLAGVEYTGILVGFSNVALSTHGEFYWATLEWVVG